MNRTSRRGALGAILAAPLASVPAMAEPDERSEYRARLLAAFAEDRAKAPIDNAAVYGSIEREACVLVSRRLWQVCEEIAALPPPRTMAGLGLAALAAAIMWEAEEPSDALGRGALGLIRAVLAFTGTELPPLFLGFGDDPEIAERDLALWEAPGGSLPAWALAEAEAKRCA